ncbi:DMT family transporter [Desulfovibrio sp. OttesenSCG-928-O18]|nr:DMT family transporter [Desulfovibrio sp. OttesenSCG-928-O18]
MGNPFVKLHLAIFIAGFTGIFGKLILLPEGPLVWWRMLFTSVLFTAYLALKKQLPRIPLREALKICGVGALIAIHWIFFYGSIKYANVSIGVVCFATIGFFTALFEPLLRKKAPSLRELCFSIITVFGVALIFHFDTRYRTGIVFGVLSAALGALFTIATRRVGARHKSGTMLLFQMTGGFAFLSLVSPLYLAFSPGITLVPSSMDLVYLLLLSSVCTIGLFLLEIQALQELPAFTVNLSFNLEPVYSIILAMLLLGEANELGAAFFTGLALICASVVLQSMYTLRQAGGLKPRTDEREKAGNP